MARVQPHAHQPRSIAETADQLLRRLLHVGAGDREGQQQLHGLVIGEAVQARLLEAVAEPLPLPGVRVTLPIPRRYRATGKEG